MKVIAKIRNEYTEKFGVPRQAGIVDETESLIVFEPEFRSPDAIRGIEEFTYLWLIWEFSENKDKKTGLTVRPPKLGGNKRVGVFASRSPYRPNPIGLSSVRLLGTVKTANEGIALRVAGADLMNGTPIYDIKPYVAYADCHPDAGDGFGTDGSAARCEVIIPGDIEKELGGDAVAVKSILSQDPRPGYSADPDRIHGMTYGNFNIRFRASGGKITVIEAQKLSDK